MSHALRAFNVAPSIDLERYFEDAARKQPSYRGQLDPLFQRTLMEHHQGVSATDCDFYHSAELPDGSFIKGEWDLRHSEASYLGACDVTAKRVIEYGPASGALSAYMAKRAAELVIFDLPFGASPELMPHPGVDLALQRASGAYSATRLRNSWWFMKQALGFEAKAVYGDIYEPPNDLGRFDISVFGAILLHLSHPFRALQRAAEITDEAIVVTDVHSAPSLAAQTAELREQIPSLMVFGPTPPPIGVIHWWALSPEAITHMLRQLGFMTSRVTTHSPSEMTSRPPLFTVVAHRARSGVAMTPVLAVPVEDDGLAVPTPHLRFMVSGTEDVGTFLTLGRRAYDAMVDSLEACEIKVGDLGRVLDFGCGVGRVLRHWKPRHELEVHGSDFYENAITWDRENLPFATFGLNELDGRLEYPDSHFGLIYALSVFTHLPIKMQHFWFAELARLLRPGGLLYFTTHGECYVHMLDEAQLAAFRSGDIVVTGGDQPGTNHCATFHPAGYIKAYLPAAFGLTLLEFKPRGARGNPDQDSYLFRKDAPISPIQSGPG